MKTLFWKIFAVGLLALGLEPGRGDSLTVPPGLEDKDAQSATSHPFSTVRLQAEEARLQQLLDRSYFTNFPNGVEISGVAFRMDADPQEGARSFDAVIPAVEVRMSTTGRTPATMSRSFLANFGSDQKVVFARGPLHWRTTLLPGQAQPFDLQIPFSEPFTYYPSGGNLLFDISVFGRVDIPLLDVEGDFGPTYRGALIVGARDLSLPSMSVGKAALMTRFTFRHIPEPSARFLGACGGMLLLLYSRVRR